MRPALPALVFLALAAPEVRAQVADLTRASCGQLLALPRADQGQLLLWLHGYYAGAAQRATLDRAKINEAAEGMLKACQAKADLPLVGAEARDILLGNVQPQVPPGSTGIPTPPATPSDARTTAPATVTTGPTPPNAAPQVPPAASGASSPPGVPRPVR